ncbi:MAG: carbon starvation CstA 5TM domain-containing protein, partial [Deltaproteobacteria bacterium]|nr:carbon starvation CstA 5TM domain-containing protein [Deltaproteobacteria bacterium]
WTPGTVITSALVVASWGFLISSGSVSTIWPMFGVANQLLAALALCVGTTILLKMGKARYAWVTLVPMAFMFVMTLTASWELFWIFAKKAALSVNPKDAFTFRLDSILVAVMAGLAVTAVADSVVKWWGLLSNNMSPVEPEAVDNE